MEPTTAQHLRPPKPLAPLMEPAPMCTVTPMVKTMEEQGSPTNSRPGETAPPAGAVNAMPFRPATISVAARSAPAAIQRTCHTTP